MPSRGERFGNVFIRTDAFAFDTRLAHRGREFPGARRARPREARYEPRVEGGAQNRGHLPHVLVVKHPENGERRLVGTAREFDVATKHFGCLRIVTHVENRAAGRVGHVLEARRNPNVREPLLHGATRDGKLPDERVDDAEHARGVAVLVFAFERGLRKRVERQRTPAEVERAVLAHFNSKVAPDPSEVGADRFGMLCDRCGDVRVGAKRRDARTVNVRFFQPDRFARRAEKRRVVDPDRRDDRRRRIDHVDGVETSAETHFEDDDVEIRALEELQNAERREFEVGKRHVAARPFDFFENLGEFVVGRFATEDTGPFVEAQEVRRRVHARTVPGRAVDAFKHRAGRALPVRARHRDDGARKADVHPSNHFPHAFEPHVDGFGVQSFNMGEPFVERGVRGHECVSRESMYVSCVRFIRPQDGKSRRRSSLRKADHRTEFAHDSAAGRSRRKSPHVCIIF